MSNEEDKQPKKLEVPTFESDIPEFLLQQSSPVEQHLLKLTSKIARNMEWQNQAIAEVDFKQQETNGKVRVMHAVYNVLSNRYVIGALIFMLLLGYPAYVSVGPTKLKVIAEKVLGLFF